MATQKLLTINELGSVLGLSRSKIYDLISKNKIQTLKIDRSVRFTEEAVDKFIAESVTKGCLICCLNHGTDKDCEGSHDNPEN